MQGLKQSFLWLVTRFQAIQKVSFMASETVESLVKFHNQSQEEKLPAWLCANRLVADDPGDDAAVRLHHVVFQGLRKRMQGPDNQLI